MHLIPKIRITVNGRKLILLDWYYDDGAWYTGDPLSMRSVLMALRWSFIRVVLM